MLATMRTGRSGAQGWGYADVLPYFRRMETSHGGEALGVAQMAHFMLPVGRVTIRCITPLFRQRNRPAIRQRLTIMAIVRKDLALPI